MLNKRKVKGYTIRKEMRKDYVSDLDKILHYNLRNKPHYTDVDVKVSWDEYLCTVQYEFWTHKHDDVAIRTVHYIVRGHSDLDVDAFLDTLIDIDKTTFTDLLPHYKVDYTVQSIEKLILE